MPDAEGLGAQDRIPREAIEAALNVHALGDKTTAAPEPARHSMRAALEAAYPLIRRAVCQELAEALRQRAGDATSEYREGYHGAAEFAESYGGASPGGEE